MNEPDHHSATDPAPDPAYYPLTEYRRIKVKNRVTRLKYVWRIVNVKISVQVLVQGSI